jgi:phosphate uptake regulator
VAARDDEIDDLYHRTFDEVVELMRADPENVQARYADPVRRRTTSSGSATVVTNIAEDVVLPRQWRDPRT